MTIFKVSWYPWQLLWTQLFSCGGRTWQWKWNRTCRRHVHHLKYFSGLSHVKCYSKNSIVSQTRTQKHNIIMQLLELQARPTLFLECAVSKWHISSYTTVDQYKTERYQRDIKMIKVWNFGYDLVAYLWIKILKTMNKEYVLSKVLGKKHRCAMIETDSWHCFLFCILVLPKIES